MAKKIDLCAPCAARETLKLKEAGKALVRVGGGVDNKISCHICGRRRYGARYAVQEAR